MIPLLLLVPTADQVAGTNTHVFMPFFHPVPSVHSVVRKMNHAAPRHGKIYFLDRVYDRVVRGQQQSHSHINSPGR